MYCLQVQAREGMRAPPICFWDIGMVTLFCQELLAPLGYALQRAIITGMGLAIMFVTGGLTYGQALRAMRQL